MGTTPFPNDIVARVRVDGTLLQRTVRGVLGKLPQDIARINTRIANQQLTQINRIASAQRQLGNLERQIATRRDQRGRFIGARRIAQLRNERRALLANARIQQTTARAQIAAQRVQKAQLGAIRAQTQGLATAFRRVRLAAFAIGSIGLFLIVRRLKQALFLGINLNKEFEAMRIGVAATLAANTNIVTSTGKQLKGLQAVVAAQQLSRKIQRQILSITLETGGTLETTLTAFRIALPLVLRVGGSLEDALDIVKRLNLAAIAIGIPIDLVRVQIDDILKGVITTRTLLAQVLGITQQQLRTAKEQGRLIDFIREKTQAFVDAQGLLLGKFAALQNRLKAIGQEFTIQATSGGFALIREAMKKIIDRLVIFDRETGKFKGFRPEVQIGIDNLRDAFRELTKAAINILPSVISLLGEMAKRSLFVAASIKLVVGGFEQLFFIIKQLFSFGSLARFAFADVRKELTGIGNRVRDEVDRLLAAGEQLGEGSGKIADALRGAFEGLGRGTQIPLQNQLESVNRAIADIRFSLQGTRQDIQRGISLGLPAEELNNLLRQQQQLEKIGQGLVAQRRVLLAAIEEVTSQRRFPVLTEKVLTLAARRLVQLKTRLEEARKSADRFPQGVFAAEKAVNSFLAQFSPNDIARINKFTDVLKKAKEATEKDAKAKRNNLLQTNFLARAIKDLGTKNERVIKQFKDEQSVMGKLNKELKELNEAVPKLGKNLEGLPSDALKNAIGAIPALRKVFEEQVGDALRRMAEDIGQAFSRIFGNILSQSRSFAASMRDILRSIVNAIIGTFIQRLVTAAVDRLLQSLRKKITDILTGKQGPLAKIIRIIFGIPDTDASKKNTEATNKNSVSTEVNTSATDRNTAAIDRLTASMQSGGTGQNLAGNLFGGFQFAGGAQQGGGFAFPFGSTQGGGQQQGVGLFGKGNPFSKANIATTATLAAAGISQLIFARSKAQKVGGALLTAAAFDPEPISKAILTIAGTLVSAFGAVFDTAARREKRRVGRVQANLERNAFSFLESKTFQFANAATIRDIFSRTFLERPGGSFQSVPAMASDPVVNINFQINALDTESFRRRGPEIIDAIGGEIEERIRQATFSSRGLASRLTQVANPI